MFTIEGFSPGKYRNVDESGEGGGRYSGVLVGYGDQESCHGGDEFTSDCERGQYIKPPSFMCAAPNQEDDIGRGK